MDLEIFNYEDKQVRTVNKNNDVWFIAKDICDILNIKNTTQAINRLDEDERAMFNIGRQGITNIVNESGLYNLIIRSDKPNAKEFKRWVTHEVLPSIRKTGGYIANDQMFIDTYLPFADELTKQLFANTLETVRKQNRLIGEMKPKVLFADAVEASKTSILVGDLAKILNQNGIDIGQNRLFAWLRKNGFLCNKKGDMYNMPTQKAMDLKLFEVKERTVNNPDGSIRITKTTKVSGKGQKYFINKFITEN